MDNPVGSMRSNTLNWVLALNLTLLLSSILVGVFVTLNIKQDLNNVKQDQNDVLQVSNLSSLHIRIYILIFYYILLYYFNSHLH